MMSVCFITTWHFVHASILQANGVEGKHAAHLTFNTSILSGRAVQTDLTPCHELHKIFKMILSAEENCACSE